jgi:hypothetical protein
MPMPVQGLECLPTHICESELYPNIWDVAIIIKQNNQTEIKNNENNYDGRTNHL